MLQKWMSRLNNRDPDGQSPAKACSLGSSVQYHTCRTFWSIALLTSSCWQTSTVRVAGWQCMLPHYCASQAGCIRGVNARAHAERIAPVFAVHCGTCQVAMQAKACLLPRRRSGRSPPSCFTLQPRCVVGRHGKLPVAPGRSVRWLMLLTDGLHYVWLTLSV